MLTGPRTKACGAVNDLHEYFAGTVPKGPLNESLVEVLLRYGGMLGLNVLLSSRRLATTWGENYQGRYAPCDLGHGSCILTSPILAWCGNGTLYLKYFYCFAACPFC